MVFRPRFCTCKAIVGRGQPGLMNFAMNRALVQDRPLDLLISSPVFQDYNISSDGDHHHYRRHHYQQNHYYYICHHQCKHQLKVHIVINLTVSDTSGLKHTKEHLYLHNANTTMKGTQQIKGCVKHVPKVQSVCETGAMKMQATTLSAAHCYLKMSSQTFLFQS